MLLALASQVTQEVPLSRKIKPTVFVKTYTVDKLNPAVYQTIAAAFSAIDLDRQTLGISGAGPQDYVLVDIAPGDYNERLPAREWVAVVGRTGNPADVRIWVDLDPEGLASTPVFPATAGGYVEGVTIECLSQTDHEETTPGYTGAAIWQPNGLPFATTILVNVVARSRSIYHNSCALQPGNRSSIWFVNCVFEQIANGPNQIGKHDSGTQPFNIQTGMDVRDWGSQNAADMIVVDSHVHTDGTTMVAGLIDLGGRDVADTFVWSGGSIDFDPSWQTTAFFHGDFWHEKYDQLGQPRWYSCWTWLDNQAVTSQLNDCVVDRYRLGLPPDFDARVPLAGIGPGTRQHYYPQALDKVSTVFPPQVTATTGSPVANRWYFLPVTISEAYTLRGAVQQVNAYAGSGGQVRYGIWTGTTKPSAWRSLGALANLATGTVTMGRGTYKNGRIYPGDTLWFGVLFTDASVTIPMDSGLAGAKTVYYQDVAAGAGVPGTPTVTVLPAGSLTPIAGILTGPNP